MPSPASTRRFALAAHGENGAALDRQDTGLVPGRTRDALNSWIPGAAHHVHHGLLAAATAGALVTFACGGGSPSNPSPTTTSAGPTTTTAPATTTVPTVRPPIGISAAADVGWCGLRGAELTGRMLDSLPGPILLPGDVAYPDGTVEDFARCYDPFWGRHRNRTYPVPGNHEYYSPGAAPYFAYFGANAGMPGEGYYSLEMGPWLVIGLNSVIPIGEGSTQLQWLRSTLASNPVKCTLAFWHHPRFSSGQNGDNGSVGAAFRALYDANADLLVAGHDHLYERMAPMDPDGRSDPARGIRQFTVGTGGASLYSFTNIKPTSEARASVWGVLRLHLRADGYDFEFLSVPGEPFRDVGSGQCH